MEEHKHHEMHKHEKKEKTDKMTVSFNGKLMVMSIALVLLIIVSGVQAVQLSNLKEKLNEDLSELAASSATKTISTGTSSSDLNKNLQNLPQMVGGC